MKLLVLEMIYHLLICMCIVGHIDSTEKHINVFMNYWHFAYIFRIMISIGVVPPSEFVHFVKRIHVQTVIYFTQCIGSGFYVKF